MYRAYVSIGEYETKQKAVEAIEYYEQADADVYTIIKEVKE